MHLRAPRAATRARTSSTVELFDPDTGSFTSHGSLLVPRDQDGDRAPERWNHPADRRLGAGRSHRERGDLRPRDRHVEAHRRHDDGARAITPRWGSRMGGCSSWAATVRAPTTLPSTASRSSTRPDDTFHDSRTAHHGAVGRQRRAPGRRPRPGRRRQQQGRRPPDGRGVRPSDRHIGRRRPGRARARTWATPSP